MRFQRAQIQVKSARMTTGARIPTQREQERIKLMDSLMKLKEALQVIYIEDDKDVDATEKNTEEMIKKDRAYLFSVIQ